MTDRYQQIGRWVSGAAHLALILWALLGGVLFRPQPPQSVQITEVATMSGAEFEAYAAASRGAGPVGRETASAPEITAPVTETGAADAPGAGDKPDATPLAQELVQPDLSEAEPDLSDFQNRQPVNVATSLPVLGNPAGTGGTAPDIPLAAASPVAGDQPDRPAVPPVPDQAAETVAPRSPLALNRSVRPPVRPDLVERRNEQLAQQAAAEAAALEAAEEAAQQEAAEELAEQQRQEAERAAAAAEAAAEAQAAQQAEAERQRQEAEEARAERERLAREAEERRLTAEREAAEQQAAAEQEAAEKQAAEQEAADRQALEDALREAQSALPADDVGTATTTTETGENRQRIEGGTGASVEQDPLAAALSEALSGQGNEQAPPPVAPSNVNQFLPRPITPRPLSSTGLQATTEPAPLGQQLSMSEREGFRIALAQCWNRGALSVEASQLAVSVRFRLGPDGRPDPDSPELIESYTGSAEAIENAFNVARRAILECGRAGFPLPREKYRTWQQVIVDFRPEGINFQ